MPPSPRPVRFRRSYLSARRGWALAAVVAGLILVGLLLRSIDRQMSLSEHGVSTIGRVVDRRISEGKATSYRVTVEYKTPKGAQDQEMTVSATTYEGAQLGSSLPVFYDSTDPRNARLGRLSPADVADWGTKWGIGWTIGGGFIVLCFYFDAVSARNQRRKLSEWPDASLVVEQVEAENSKGETLKATGWYLDGAGQRIVAKDVKVGKSIRMGEPVTILYNPASNEVCTLDSLNCVEVDEAFGAT